MKKIAIMSAGLLSVLVLSGCSSQTVVTDKGGKITKDEYYNKMIKTQSGKQTLQSLILEQTLEGEFGDKVPDKTIDKKVDDIQKQFGGKTKFDEFLKQQGVTRADYKKSVKDNLLLEQAVKHYKKISKKDLDKAWKSYEPKVKVKHILVKDEATAKTVIEKVSKDPKKTFDAAAKEYSTDNGTKDNGGSIPEFDNTDKSLDNDFKTAAFKLKTGEVTPTPVKTQFGYHVIYMVDNPGKGTEKKAKKALENQIYAQWMQDQSVVQDVLKHVIKDGNVSIKESSLKDVLNDILHPAASAQNGTNKTSTSETTASESGSSSEQSAAAEPEGTETEK